MLLGHRVLICDRDAKWSGRFRRLLADAGVRVVQTPYQAARFASGEPSAHSSNTTIESGITKVLETD
jgi:hypothetical protein